MKDKNSFQIVMESHMALRRPKKRTENVYTKRLSPGFQCFSDIVTKKKKSVFVHSEYINPSAFLCQYNGFFSMCSPHNCGSSWF